MEGTKFKPMSTRLVIISYVNTISVLVIGFS